MANSPSCSSFSRDQQKLHLQSIRVLLLSVNQHFNIFLSDPAARKSVQLYCNSKLKRQKQEFFEFSEHSVLSNLYWGIENFEAACRAKCEEEKDTQLKNSEQMLQVPALLDEHGKTSGISNRYLVCCSYFYLSLVRRLHRDEWQMTLHFLQALLVSPRLVRRKFLPELWEFLFLSQIIGENRKLRSGELSEEAIDEGTRQLGRRYKDWMMYYQVVLYGEIPQWLSGDKIGTTHEEEEPLNLFDKSASTKYLESNGQADVEPVFHDVQMVYPLNLQESINEKILQVQMVYPLNLQENINEGKNANAEDSKVSFAEYSFPVAGKFQYTKLEEIFHPDMVESLSAKRLHDMLKVPQSDTSTICSLVGSAEGPDLEERIYHQDSKVKILTTHVDVLASEFCDGKTFLADVSSPEAFSYPIHVETHGEKVSSIFSSRSQSSVHTLPPSILELRDIDSQCSCNCYLEDAVARRTSGNRSFRQLDHQESFTSQKLEANWNFEKENNAEILGRFGKAISSLCFSDVSKEVIFDQLLNVISTSKEDNLIRDSASLLLVLISENRSDIEGIRREKSCLRDLANALKRNVHEAAVLMYLLNPSPADIKELEILPALMEIISNSNNYNVSPISSPVTPTTAALAMIDVLVTKFDYVTNKIHLEAISSPPVLSGLVNIVQYKNKEDGTAVARILMRCLRLNENSRNYLSHITPLAPFLHLLRSNERRAKFTALEFFHEILRMPRSKATSLLHQIRRLGNINLMHTLMACIQKADSEHRVLAANLLLQLDAMEDLDGKSIFRDEAMEVLLDAITFEENPDMQILSASVLSNLGGTYAWNGEPYTAAWLLKKMGLSNPHHRNMIKNIDWSDKIIQDNGTDAWCSKIGRSVLKIGESVFHALVKGLQSKIKSVSRDCLITIAWLGCEISEIGPTNLRHSFCEILLSELVDSMHPGLDLEERLLACMCLYKYTSGKGMENIMNVSGLRESLRRLSSITWMAEELLKVTDHVLPKKSHVSCVHTQILEASQNVSGSASALIYYKGQLYSGHSDGSIKVWDVKGQTAKLVWEIKGHKKMVTCFTLLEPGDCLLSGSTDKTIKVWQVIQRKLACVEVIEMKEPIHKMESYGQLIFLVTQSCGLKVCDESRNIKLICKSKHVKCIAVAKGKVYLGCMDSSIEEIDILRKQMKEIKAPGKSWWNKRRPVNSVSLYGDWVYSGSDAIHGSELMEQQRERGLQFSKELAKGTHVVAMAVVEDFMYINCSSSPSIIQIWLRETQQVVGRLSAGSRITSLLIASDVVLCGTEAGLIKGWVPF